MFQLSDRLWFPPVEHASEEGLLAFGGGLATERLLLAYRSGIFPWYEAGQPILWWSPDPRMVLFLEEFKISKSFIEDKINLKVDILALSLDFRAFL